MQKWKIAVALIMLGGLAGCGGTHKEEREPKATTTGATMTGATIALEEIKDEVTLLEFWRANDKRSQWATPPVEKLRKQYSELKVVAFYSSAKAGSAEDNPNLARAAIKKLGITDLVAFDQGGPFFKSIGGAAYPTFVVINRQGNIEYADAGYTKERARALSLQIEVLMKKDKVS